MANIEDRLETAYQYVRKSFFPRWDRDRQWTCHLIHDLPSGGRCFDDRKEIAVQYVSDNDDELYALLIHEICHAFAMGHDKGWQKRMLKAAEKAHELGLYGVQNILASEVKEYSSTPNVTANDIYEAITNVVFDSGNTLSLNDVANYLASKHGYYTDEFMLQYKRCEYFYDKAVKAYQEYKQTRRRFKKFKEKAE